ncbi:hypothetical protein MVEN_01312400 [Mycena venus]|uniref:WW domain-containing protein n=1 Tax=Mycena venus TaxID=2733690 RepID=A0A8H6XXJ9_9AGAR|nr:hypothetical protein MVEN_01312400 [Mycena venus]
MLAYQNIFPHHGRIPSIHWHLATFDVDKSLVPLPSSNPASEVSRQDGPELTPVHTLPGGPQASGIETKPAHIHIQDNATQNSPAVIEPAKTTISSPASDPTPPIFCPSGSARFPTAPELLQRYEQRKTITKEEVKVTLEPHTRSFSRNGPVDWTAHVHPEGALYYAYDPVVSHGAVQWPARNLRKLWNIFTDAPLHEKPAFEMITTFIRQIEKFCSTNGIPLDPETDLVLELTTDKDDQPTCGYYLVDHRQRIIFWYDAFEMERLSRCYQMYGVRSLQHTKIELTAQYWYHCSFFPSTLHVMPELVRELRDTVVYSLADSMTSETPTVPYSVDDLLKMLTVIESTKENTETDHGGTACAISRFMWSFECHKFYHFHGEACARLDRKASAFGYVATRSILLRIFAPLLFNAPIPHLRALEELYTDEVINNGPWRSLIDGLCVEWQEHILYATVLLNADMAFLAIPTVDNGQNIPARSMAQIASYISVIASLGSVIVGLVLVREYRSRRDDLAESAAAVLGRHFHAPFGFESLALLYSLPFALLMWGTVTFFISFLGMCFQFSDTPARSLVACTTVLAVFGHYYKDWPPIAAVKKPNSSYWLASHFQNEIDAFRQQRNVYKWR